MLKRSAILLIGLAVFAAAAIFGIRAMTANGQQPADLASSAAFASYNTQVASRNDELDQKIVDKVMQNIDLERQGYGTPSKVELADDIRQLQLADRQLSADSTSRRKVERDLAWCQKKLKGAK